jgi:polyphosphate kinase (polyphosphoric acid kinase) (ATP-polyphosphate phosphotransferase)
MKKVKKRVKKKAIILVLIPLVLIIAIIVVNVKNMLAKPLTVEVVSSIDEYNYYLENTDSRIYKKYYKELESELEDQKIDEENYVSLLAKLFTIDFYTLNNKMTNQDIGGIQFVHESQKESFKTEATNNIYKYVKNNLTGKRKQELPEIKNATVEEVKQFSYENEGANLEDNSAYQTKVKLEYVKDLDYPTEVNLTWIHEGIKLSLVEVE